MTFEVVTHGFHELEAAFADVKVKVDPETGKALRAVGTPIQQTAQALAVSNIRNIGSSWSQMKVGRSTTSVYIAERQRRRSGSPRPNLSSLLFMKALLPAEQQHSAETEAAIKVVIEALCAKVGTVR